GGPRLLSFNSSRDRRPIFTNPALWQGKGTKFLPSYEMSRRRKEPKRKWSGWHITMSSQDFLTAIALRSGWSGPWPNQMARAIFRHCFMSTSTISSELITLSGGARGTPFFREQRTASYSSPEKATARPNLGMISLKKRWPVQEGTSFSYYFRGYPRSGKRLCSPGVCSTTSPALLCLWTMNFLSPPASASPFTPRMETSREHYSKMQKRR